MPKREPALRKAELAFLVDLPARSYSFLSAFSIIKRREPFNSTLVPSLS